MMSSIRKGRYRFFAKCITHINSRTYFGPFKFHLLDFILDEFHFFERIFCRTGIAFCTVRRFPILFF